MNGIELTDRLIQDISKSLILRRQVKDPIAQIESIGLSGQINLKDFMTALNIGTFDSHLDILSQFLNIKNRLVDHDKGEKVDISIFQRDISKAIEQVGDLFQQILDNERLRDFETNILLSELLISELDWIHINAN